MFDEPTNGLDVESTRQFYDLMLDRSAQGSTILFSTHLMDHVTRLCSHVVVINRGTVVADEDLDELQSSFGAGTPLEDIFVRLTGEHS